MSEKPEITTILLEMSANQREYLVSQNNQQKALDRVFETLEKTNETLLRNTITVEEHHKRSNLLEQELRRIDAKVSEEDIQHLKAQAEAVEHTRNLFKSLQYLAKIVGWIIGGLSTLGGMLWGLYQIAQKIGL